MLNKTIYTIFIYIALAAALTSCHDDGGASKPEKKTVDTVPMIVSQIRQCSRLYTTEYHIHKIVTHRDKVTLDGKIGQRSISFDMPMTSRSIAIPMDATVKAYVDLGQFSKSSVKREGRKITITLPDPHVMLTSTRINHDDVKQYTSLISRDFSDEEMSSYERQGRQQIIASLADTDIIGHARETAARIIVPMLTQMGYADDDITIDFRKDLTMNQLIDATTIENNAKENK